MAARTRTLQGGVWARQAESLSLAVSRAVRTKPLPRPETGGGDDSLRRCLGLGDVVGFGIGVTVGGGIFVATGVAALEAGPAVMLSFLLASFGCACSGLCYAEMSSVAPSAGSSYSFSYHGIGELAACIVGVVNIVGSVLSGAAVARGWASYLYFFLLEVGLHPPSLFRGIELEFVSVSPLACVAVLVLGVVNLYGAKAASAMNGVITVLSVSLLVAFIIGGAFAVDTARWSPFFPEGGTGVVRGAGTVFFAYLGFDTLACLGAEATDATVVPRGIIATLVISTTLYIATAAVFTGMVTQGDIEVAAPLAAAAQLRGLKVIALAVSCGAIGNTLTTVLGGILGAPRICYAMAQDGLLPTCLSAVDAAGTPRLALMVTVLPTALLAGFMEFGPLADIVSAGALCSFTLVCTALVLLRCPESAAESVDGEARKRELSDLAPTSFGSPLEVKQTSAKDVVSPDCFKVDGQDDGPALLSAQPSRRMGGMWCLHGGVCLVAGLLTRVPQEEIALRAVTILMWLAALVTAFLVICIYRHHEGIGPESSLESSKGFRIPLMPLAPLIGLEMNVLLLSQMPLQALATCVGVDGVVVLFYFAYSAPRSQLNRQRRQQFVRLSEDFDT